MGNHSRKRKRRRRLKVLFTSLFILLAFVFLFYVLLGIVQRRKNAISDGSGIYPDPSGTAGPNAFVDPYEEEMTQTDNVVTVISGELPADENKESSDSENGSTLSMMTAGNTQSEIPAETNLPETEEAGNETGPEPTDRPEEETAETAVPEAEDVGNEAGPEPTDRPEAEEEPAETAAPITEEAGNETGPEPTDRPETEEEPAETAAPITEEAGNEAGSEPTDRPEAEEEPAETAAPATEGIPVGMEAGAEPVPEKIGIGTEVRRSREDAVNDEGAVTDASAQNSSEPKQDGNDDEGKGMTAAGPEPDIQDASSEEEDETPYYLERYSSDEPDETEFEYEEDDMPVVMDIPFPTVLPINKGGVHPDTGLRLYPRSESDYDNSLLNPVIPETGMAIPQIYQFNYNYPICKVESSKRSAKTSGCGATVISMLDAYVNQNYNQTPYTVLYDATKSGIYKGAGLDYWVVYDELVRRGIEVECEKRTMSRIRKELEAGHPIVLRMGPGTFTDNGHYILLRGMDGEDMVYVNDPNNWEHSNMSFPISLLNLEAKANDMFVIYNGPEAGLLQNQDEAGNTESTDIE